VPQPPKRVQFIEHTNLLLLLDFKHNYTQPYDVHPTAPFEHHPNLLGSLDDLVGVLPRQQRVRGVSLVLLLAIRVGRSGPAASTLLEHVLRASTAAGERDDLCALLVVLQD
jgi:hypothetical protein